MPQQPPTTFSQPFAAHARKLGARMFLLFLENQSVKAHPADPRSDRRSCSTAKCAPALPRTIPFHPDQASNSNREMSGCACAIDMSNASTVCPLKFRPDLSITVPEIIKGTLRPVFSNASLIANNAAFPLSVSKMVSTMRRSTPPSSSGFRLIEISLAKLIERDRAKRRIVYVR